MSFNNIQGVDQVAIIGIPHDDWGEQVIALIIPDVNQTVLKEEIFQYCKQNLARYKQPKEILFVSDFPLTTYGKVDKKEMRKSYWKETERVIN